MEPFEVWLLPRVAQAVEAGDVPAELLMELQAEIEAACKEPQEEGHAEAGQDIAEKLSIPLKRAEHMLAGLEAQPSVMRELLMRQVAGGGWRGQGEAKGRIRNRKLHGSSPRAARAPEEPRRRSAWLTRKLRLLRAHGPNTKITGTHRYQLTASGRKAITAILTALRSTVRQLTPLAA
jgi:hypothetical protein